MNTCIFFKVAKSTIALIRVCPNFWCNCGQLTLSNRSLTKTSESNCKHSTKLIPTQCRHLFGKHVVSNYDHFPTAKALIDWDLYVLDSSSNDARYIAVDFYNRCHFKILIGQMITATACRKRLKMVQLESLTLWNELIEYSFHTHWSST